MTRKRSRRCASSIPALRGAAAGSPGLARFPLTAAPLVIARQYGIGSWAPLRRNVAAVIQLAGSAALGGGKTTCEGTRDGVSVEAGAA